MGQEQALLGTGDPHIAETTLLLHRGRIIQGAVTGKQTLFQTNQENHRKLKTLAGMQGHQRDLVLLRILAVCITSEGG